MEFVRVTVGTIVVPVIVVVPLFATVKPLTLRFPVIKTFPLPLFTVSVCVVDWDTFPPKEMAPLFALVLIVLFPVKVAGTALVMVNELAVIFDAIFTLLVPTADDTIIGPRLVDPPIAPLNVITPAVPEFNVSDCDPAAVPLIVFENEIFAPAGVPPPFVASATTTAVNVTGPVIPIVPPLVVMLPPILMAVGAV